MMASQFRSTFKLLHKKSIQWFPGHMGKGLRQMQQKLKTVDCVIEVHDARIPLSGRNPEFKYTIGGVKPHLLVLNKKDLANTHNIANIGRAIKTDEGIDEVLFTNCKDQQCRGVQKLVPTVINLINNSDRFNRSELREFSVMVIGVPNVGKSSILNILRNKHLRKKRATAVGGVAGITRSVLNRIKICEDPLIYMIDTPGILTPHIQNDEVGMKLALCSCFQDHLVGEEIIADYLLYWLNKHGIFDYVDALGLEEPTDSVMQLLVSGANKFEKHKKLKNYDGQIVFKPDTSFAARHFISLFRTGGFGKLNLDDHSFG